MSDYHTSVLLQEAIDLLDVQPGKQYIDGTLGGGGHTSEILRLGGNVLGLDVDDEALAYVEQELRSKNQEVREHLVLAKGNFKDINKLARGKNIDHAFGILLDLGVSSNQFDKAERGFSIQKDGPLDMRMDHELQVTAKDMITVLNRGELVELFSRLGEERFSKRIAEGIIQARKVKPIETTEELAQIIKSSVPNLPSQIHPATKVFQALRIAVNDEMNVLREVLPKALELLAPGGRIVIISFHSLEDRMVKHQFRQWKEEGLGEILTKKPIVPTEEEIEQNKRSRSAKMRGFQKK